MQVPLVGFGYAWVDEGCVVDLSGWSMDELGFVSKKAPWTSHRQFLHKLIMGGVRADVGFLDGDRTNCTSSNLVVSAPGKGRRPRPHVRRGTSPFRGVFRRTHGGMYYASLCHRRSRELYLGDYRDPVEAAKMWDAAVRYYGANRQPNFEGTLSLPQWRILERLRPFKRFRGVRKMPRLKFPYWAVYGRMVLGKFKSPERAALSYDRYVRRKLGKKARLNFPDDGLPRLV